MGQSELQKIGGVSIGSRDDILRCAQSFRDVAQGYGLRMLAWHNLGSPLPMTS